MSELPKSWVLAPFMSIFDIQGGTQPPKKVFVYEPRENYLRLLQIRDFGAKPLPTYIPYKSSLKTCSEEDILIARYGASIGRILTGMNGAYNVAMARVVIPTQIYRKYVFYILNSYYFQRPILGIERSAQDGFNKDDLEEIELPVAPYNEQKRIVEKLEKLLGKVEAAKERLDKVPVILKRFRQSVLAAACSGKLTTDWRHENSKEISPIEYLGELVQRRKDIWERREEFRIERLSQNGKRTTRGRYKQHFDPEANVLPDIPDSWLVASVSQLAILDVGFAFKSAEFANQGIRLLRGENLEPGALRWTDVKYWPESELSGLEHLLIDEGEIILAMDRPVISSGLKIARAKKSDLPCVLVQRMTRFKMVDEALTEFLYLNLMLPRFIDHLSHGLTGSDLPHITGDGLAKYVIGFPPLEEQKEIVRRVEDLFKFADKIEVRYKKARSYTDKLTQSILAKAFRGELVPQNPNDEPASELLERIRKERTT